MFYNEIYMRPYNSEFFDSIDAYSSDVKFQQIITFGCLCHFWHGLKINIILKSSRSSELSDVGIPSLSSHEKNFPFAQLTFGQGTTVSLMSSFFQEHSVRYTDSIIFHQNCKFSTVRPISWPTRPTRRPCCCREPQCDAGHLYGSLHLILGQCSE